MADIIEQAYQSPEAKSFTNWDRLYHWLEDHEGGKAHDLMEATQRAQRAGVPFPQDSGKARQILNQYSGGAS